MSEYFVGEYSVGEYSVSGDTYNSTLKVLFLCFVFEEYQSIL